MDQKEWTIMIYMAGDNNLSVDMAYAMEQIKDVAGEDTESINLFVYYDGSSSAIPTLYCDFSNAENPRHVRSHMVKNKLYPVDEKHNENAADSRSVLNFVDWCVNIVKNEDDGTTRSGRRAKKYALIFSGHSMGFQDIGMFKDESADHTMGMEEMNSLLERITKSSDVLIAEAGDQNGNADQYNSKTREILGQKLDILGFDSCVMGMFEVGYQFNSVAKTMVASEGSVPNAGWTYAKIFGSLASQPDHKPVTEIVADFVSEFIKSQDSFTIGGVSVDMAAWDLSKLSDLNTEFEKLSEKLLECFQDEGSTTYRQMERALLQVHWKCQSYMYDQNVDLGDFCELLRGECESLINEVGVNEIPILEDLRKHCEGVLGELKNAVILSGFCGGGYQYSNGISLFFPWSLGGYTVSQENYEGLRFVRETGAGKSWNQFLNKYLRDVTFRRAVEPIAAESGAPAIGLEKALSAVAGADVSAYGMDDTKLRYHSFDFEDGALAEIQGAIGEVETKMAGHEGSKMAGHEGSKMAGHEGSKMAGHEGSKMAGHEGSKMAGHEGSKMAGHEGSKMAGHEGSKMAGHEGSKMAGHEGSKMAGHEGSKMAGHEGSKMAGHEGSKMAGHEGSKMAGHEGSKMAGHEGSKMAGHEGSKMAGHEGSKLAGHDHGGSSAFFSSFKHFKNIETPWNLSGFTKKPKKLHGEKEMKKATH